MVSPSGNLLVAFVGEFCFGVYLFFFHFFFGTSPFFKGFEMTSFFQACFVKWYLCKFPGSSVVFKVFFATWNHPVGSHHQKSVGRRFFFSHPQDSSFAAGFQQWSHRTKLLQAHHAGTDMDSRECKGTPSMPLSDPSDSKRQKEKNLSIDPAGSLRYTHGGLVESCFGCKKRRFVPTNLCWIWINWLLLQSYGVIGRKDIWHLQATELYGTWLVACQNPCH